jgi:hypothetical protein
VKVVVSGGVVRFQRYLASDGQPVRLIDVDLNIFEQDDFLKLFKLSDDWTGLDRNIT